MLRQLAAGAALREDPEALIQRLFLAVAGPMKLDFFIHYRLADDGDLLNLGSTAGVDDRDLPALATMVLGEAVCGLVAETRTCLTYADVDRSEDERLALAVSLGARSYMSYPLLDGSELLGTWSFGSRTRGRLTEAELEVLRMATDGLAAAIAHQRDHGALSWALRQLEVVTGRVEELTEENARLLGQVEHLTTALASRDHIARAKGMLMLRLGVTDDVAWQLLVRLSQHTNRKLRDVASALAAHLAQGTALPGDLDHQLYGGRRAGGAEDGS